MSASQDDQFAKESSARLIVAEQKGLRLAIACRTLITGAAFAWYVAAPFLFTGFEPRIAAIIVLCLFTVVGVAHLAIIGTRYDQWWIKYLVYALDMLSICATFALIPISRADDIPQIIAFRAYGIYYLFPLLAMSCLSLSWRLVLWTGFIGVIGWWTAFVAVTLPMSTYLSWADIPASATRADYEAVFLSIDFIGRGNRIEETAMLMFTALALAVAVYRARAVFFAQVASDITSRSERRAREKVSRLLRQYVPEEVAAQLISSDAPLKPKLSEGTALVLDIAGFTSFTAAHAPQVVIDVLDRFLADATGAVAAHGGIVMSYLGDGFLVTFNAPVAVDHPQQAALRAAKDLVITGTDHGFAVRVGIASGALVTGTIGSEERQSFTVYGDPVNLAARLEAAAKTLGVTILVDGSTKRAIDDQTSLKAHPPMTLRGFPEPVECFSLTQP